MESGDKTDKTVDFEKLMEQRTKIWKAITLKNNSTSDKNISSDENTKAEVLELVETLDNLNELLIGQDEEDGLKIREYSFKYEYLVKYFEAAAITHEPRIPFLKKNEN